MAVLLVTAAIIAAGYLISLRLHPLMNCGRCKGTNKHRGAIYSYAYRPCRRCKGSGRKRRLGARVLGKAH
jgi:DnaJ-class molecular chaperone